ncbi:hypothetical protein NIES4101_87080 [Calothrix sp. NIES-4101]|nr:hypothetical protein NIES4101_87080 [Calothrix sp. NIES-4101]
MTSSKIIENNIKVYIHRRMIIFKLTEIIESMADFDQVTRMEANIETYLSD